MSFMGYIPDAPLPPRPAHVELGPHQPLDFQHQLLYKAQELRSRAIPVAPRPPAPMRIDRGIMRSEWDLASQLVLALIRLKAGRVPLAPPPPAPARFRVWPALMLARPLDDELKLAAQRLRPVRRIPRAPLAPAPARLTVKPWALPFDQVIAKASTDFYANRRKALPRDVQEEAVRAAKDMRKALAEHNPPLAPAAPAPVLSASAPLAKPVELEAAKAAKEMTIAHYPPLAPANPAPDMIAKDAVLTKPLQEKLVPAAIKAMQNVEHPPMIVPDAPPAPPAYRARRDFIMAQPFKDLLYTTVKQKKLARKQHQAKLDFVPVPRALEATHAVVPPVVAAPAKVAPPLPPRPAESLAAIEAMRGLRGNMVVHDKEKVIQHAPIVEKEIVNERPVEVKHEHHIQPVVHEVEHRIQPIIKTEATTATTVIETDKSVMLPPIVEPAVTVSATPVVAPVAAPMAVPSVSVPQTRAAPITTATVLPYLPMASYGAGQGMLDSEERMGLGVVAPIMPGEKEIVLEGLARKERKSHRKHGAALSPTAVPDTTLGTGAHSRTGTALSPNTSTATRGRRGSIGMKIKGAVKEVTGTLTRNPAKVEEGKMLMHGVDPATNPSAASSSVSSTSRI